MDEKGKELRGDAAWRAAKQEIYDRNEAAFARGRERRAEHDADAASRKRALEQADRSSLPEQPGR